MSSLFSNSQSSYSAGTSDMDTGASPLSSASSIRSFAGTEAQEHPVYHFFNGSVSFELEGTKYRIHESLLSRHCFAPTCREDLRDPTAAGITRTELDTFLSLLYITTYELLNLNLPVESWIFALRLATRWKADGIRKLTIKTLSAQASPVEKLFLCRIYDVPEWPVPACAALALRPDPLTMDEAVQLEKRDIVRVFTAREAIQQGKVAATETAASEFLATLFPETPMEPPVAPRMPIPKTEAPNAAIGVEASISDPHPNTLPCEESCKTLLYSTGSSSKIARETPTPTLSLPPPPSLRPAAKPSRGNAPAAVSESSEASSSDEQAQQSALQTILADIRAKKFEDALALVTKKNVELVGRNIPVGSLALLRAVMWRAFRRPTFIHLGAQLLSLLSERTSQKIAAILNDDMQSLAACWYLFRHDRDPGPDRGGLMFDIAKGRAAYQNQINHAKGFFRALTRLDVIPPDNKWLIMLVD